MNPYLDVLRKYAVFGGRARRSEYWGFLLINLAIGFGLVIVDVLIGSVDKQGYGLLSGLYALATTLPAIAVLVRRLHDTWHSGWWAFLLFVPLIGPIVLLVWLATDSQPGQNKYGPNPKGVSN
jgi:uncharacterized membrane protein YhaH (DUF805 family)